jgi:hypothetical protein
MAPDFAGTTAFSFSDTPPPLPVRPSAPTRRAAAVQQPDDDGMKTQEMAPDFAATTAFTAHDLPPTLPKRAPRNDPAPVFDAEKTTVLTDGFAAALAGFDAEKTVILKGGFDSTVNAATGSGARFTEELFPALDSPPSGNFSVPRKSIKDLPPEDFDKTVEISGGFESQPAEEEAPLDDLFPPIKF